jgi:TPR repeat protein
MSITIQTPFSVSLNPREGSFQCQGYKNLIHYEAGFFARVWAVFMHIFAQSVILNTDHGKLYIMRKEVMRVLGGEKLGPNEKIGQAFARILHEREGLSLFEGGEKVYSQNASEAIQLYKLAASHGNIKAQSELSRKLFFGEGIQPNLAEAARWAKLAADKGDSQSQWILGMMCAMGLGGVERDFERAVRLFNAAIDHGNHKALIALGFMYLQGLGVEQDPNKAMQLCQNAVRMGCTEGYLFLGAMYQGGRGVMQDATMARECYQHAIEKGDVNGYVRMGNLLLSTFNPSPEAQREAVLHYTLAANKGSAAGQACLGEMYRKGQGVEKQDISRAVDLFQLAANQNCLIALITLTALYRGALEGVTPNSEKYQLYLDRVDAFRENNAGIWRSMYFGEGGSSLSDN